MDMAGLHALGLEFSTQSAKALVLEIESGEVTQTVHVDYDASFPAYRTRGGVLPSDEPDVRHTSPAMLLDALDVLFARLAARGAPLSQIAALKIDAQQHCTVYTDATLTERLRTLAPHISLSRQLNPAFTRVTVPIWEDRSTANEAERLESALAPAGGMLALTGNRAELRFPAAQILKWATNSPFDYDRTEHIMVLSAFLSSVVTGEVAPVDTGDGWGTNLNHLDSAQPGWNRDVLAVLDAELGSEGVCTDMESKLGRMLPYDTSAGSVASYFVDRYGLSSECAVLTGTGDNPATLLGTGGRIVISLGSSYTVNGVLDKIQPDPHSEYNLFGYIPGQAMGLSVVTNGAKVHDEFMKRYVRKQDWDEYRTLAGGRLVSAEERLLLPYVQSESVPRAPRGILRDGFSAADASSNVRALHISQALSLRLHSDHLSVPESICIVGGASKNRLLCAMITDAFGVPTYAIEYGQYAAPLGCAVSAAREIEECTYAEAADRYVKSAPGSQLDPDRAFTAVYQVLLARYADLERSATR